MNIMVNTLHDFVKSLIPSSISLSIFSYSASQASLEFFRTHQLRLPDSLHFASCKRQCDYLAGRYCVRQLFIECDVSLSLLPVPDINGAPAWSDEVVGSVTHSSGIAIAMVSKKEYCSEIGIDFEKIVSLSFAKESYYLIMTQREHDHLIRYFDEEIGYTLLFSAKESIYKALYPRVKAYFDFLDVDLISCNAESGVFQFKLNDYLAKTTHLIFIAVHFQIISGFVFTWVILTQ